MSFLIRILLALLALGAAALARGESPPIVYSPQPVVVGATMPLSGPLAAMGEQYRRALELWRDEVNAAGGLLGRRVELRLHDDASDGIRARTLYGQLIEEEKADLLIGPVGSAATLMAASQAEAARRVLVNGSGASRVVHRRPWRYVFQSAVPSAAHGAAVAELAKASGLRSALILAREDALSREQAEAAREAALEQGIEVPELVVYRASVTDFTPLVQKAAALGVQGWIAYGAVRDSADMVRTFKKQGYAPAFFFASAADEPRFIDFVGQDAEYSLATREYAADFPTSGNARFVEAYRARWSVPPGTAAAEGYAAATVLGEAVRRAGTLDQDALREVLAKLETETVLGGYRVDPRTGAQLAARPAVVQVVRGRPQVVWPQAWSAAPRLPYLPWDERRLLR